MNYNKIYDQLIERGVIRQDGKNRKVLKSEIGLVERHHIVPKIIGGNDVKNNLVYLTPEEHLIAHLLLVKIYNIPSLIYAANWMTNRIKNNKEYGWVKREFARTETLLKTGVARSKKSTEKQSKTILEKYKNGYKSPITGQVLTQEHRDAISAGNIGKQIPLKNRSSLDGYIMRYGVVDGTLKYDTDRKKKDSQSENAYIKKYGIENGKQKFIEHCSLMSSKMSGENNSFFGKTHSEESRNKISVSNTGKPKIRTHEHNNKLGAANKGKLHTKIVCPHCSKEGGCTSMKRWHFDNCKHKIGK